MSTITDIPQTKSWFDEGIDWTPQAGEVIYSRLVQRHGYPDEMPTTRTRVIDLTKKEATS